MITESEFCLKIVETTAIAHSLDNKISFETFCSTSSARPYSCEHIIVSRNLGGISLLILSMIKSCSSYQLSTASVHSSCEPQPSIQDAVFKSHENLDRLGGREESNGLFSGSTTMNYQLAKAQRALQRRLIFCRKAETERPQWSEINHDCIRMFVYLISSLIDRTSAPFSSTLQLNGGRYTNVLFSISHIENYRYVTQYKKLLSTTSNYVQFQLHVNIILLQRICPPSNVVNFENHESTKRSLGL